MGNKACIVCGKPVERKGNKFCSRACFAEYRQHKRKCAICGTLFPVAKSSGKICCSPACSKKRRQQLQSDGVYKEPFKKLHEKRKEYIDTHRGEKHHKAQYWCLQSPTGNVYKVKNLYNFISQNLDLFDGSTIRQAYDGISKIKYSRMGKRKMPNYTYKGWRLLDWKE
jgi:predicted nucleic acid-binding Zn ribbon protein